MNGPSTNIQALNMLERHGERPEGSNVETVEKILVSTAAFAGGATLTEKALFANQNLPSQYENEQFPSAGVAYTINGIQIEHNFQFTQSTIGTALVQEYFEKYSRLVIMKSDKVVLDIDVATALPFFTANLGTTVSLHPRRSSWLALQNRIAIAANERVTVTLRPASNLTLAAVTTATSPYLPGLTLAADQGYAATVKLRTYYHRKVA